MGRHVTQLRWFFGEGRSLFEGGSSMGPMLEQAKARHVEMEPTPRVHRRRGQAPGTCIQCQAPLSAETCDVCGFSEALGRKRLTAQHGTETRTFRWEPAEDTDVRKYAELGRQLSRVRARSAHLARALEALYGDVGARYMVDNAPTEVLRQREASYSPYFTLLAIFPMTPAGGKLDEIALKDTRSPAMPSHERVFRVVAADKGKLASAISEAHRQALKLREDAHEAWRKAGEQDG